MGLILTCHQRCLIRLRHRGPSCRAVTRRHGQRSRRRTNAARWPRAQTGAFTSPEAQQSLSAIHQRAISTITSS